MSKITKGRANIFLYASCLSVNLLSFSTGSAFSWTSPVLPKLNSNNTDINPLGKPITTFVESWMVSALSLGAMLGAVISAPIANRVGRRQTLLIMSKSFFTSQLMFAFGKTVRMYLVARFTLGTAVGCVYATIPSFVGEMSEDHNRGLLGCVMGIMVFTGVFLNYVVGPYVSIRILSFVNMIPILIFYAICVRWIPETPYYYLSIDEEVAAFNSLKKLRNNSRGSLDKELKYMKEILQEQAANKGEMRDILQSDVLRRGLHLLLGLFIFQQLSGINAVCAFMETIFVQSRSTISPQISVIIIGGIQIIVNMSTTSLVDRLGRRIMLLTSTSGIFVSSLSIASYFLLSENRYDTTSIDWVPIVSLLIFVTSYNIGIGPVVWVMTGEIFPVNFKAIASSICTFLCLALTFIVTLLFPYMVTTMGMAYSFYIFASFGAASVLYTAIMVPETKGKSFRSIQSMLSNRNSTVSVELPKN